MNEENLITDNLKLINYTIKKMNLYWNTEDEYQDYYDAGLLGLIRGVKKYDPSVGKISTFLVTCIRNAINVEINNKNQSRHKNEYGNDLSLEYEYIEPSGDVKLLNDTRVIIDLKANLEEISHNLCNSLEHARIHREIDRAREIQCKEFIFLIKEDKIKSVQDLQNWTSKRTKVTGKTLYKVMCTMKERYDVKFIICSRKNMPQKIIELLGADKDESFNNI